MIPPPEPEPRARLPRLLRVATLSGLSVVLLAGIIVTTMAALDNVGVQCASGVDCMEPPCSDTSAISGLTCVPPTEATPSTSDPSSDPTDAETTSGPDQQDASSGPADEPDGGSGDSGGDPESGYRVGDCVDSAQAGAEQVDCGAAGPDGYVITDEVTHPSGCPDKDQPTLPAADGETTFCLAPLSD